MKESKKAVQESLEGSEESRLREQLEMTRATLLVANAGLNRLKEENEELAEKYADACESERLLLERICVLERAVEYHADDGCLDCPDLLNSDPDKRYWENMAVVMGIK